MLEHVNMVAVKAQKSAVALCTLMPNKGGPCSSIRKVLPGQWCILFYFMQIQKEQEKAGIGTKKSGTLSSQCIPVCLHRDGPCYLWNVAHQDPS